MKKIQKMCHLKHKLQLVFKKRNPKSVESFFTGSEFSEPPTEEKSAREYFHLIFDKLLYERIAEQINLYSVERAGKSVNKNKEEIEQFIGILVQIGIMKYPQYQMYWLPQ